MPTSGNMGGQHAPDGRVRRGRERRDATRQSLVLAARRVIEERGLAQVTLDHIAEFAKVSRGTIYTHFQTKAEVLGAVLDDLVAGLEASVSGVDLAPGAPPPEDQLAANLVRVLHVLFDNQLLTRLLFVEVVADEPAVSERALAFLALVRRLLREALVDGAAVGLVRPVDTDIATAALFGAVREVVCTVDLGDHDDLGRRVDIAWHVISVCLCGVATPALQLAVADAANFAAAHR